MSIAPGYRGTNTIMQELDDRIGNIKRDPRFIVFGPGQPDPNADEEELAAYLKFLKAGNGVNPNANFMSVRAKFTCVKAEGYSYDNFATIAGKNIALNAVVRYGNDGTRHDENESWSQQTPSGQLNIHISNPAAFDQFEVGKDYYIDFTPVEG